MLQCIVPMFRYFEKDTSPLPPFLVVGFALAEPSLSLSHSRRNIYSSKMRNIGTFSLNLMITLKKFRSEMKNHFGTSVQLSEQKLAKSHVVAYIWHVQHRRMAHDNP